MLSLEQPMEGHTSDLDPAYAQFRDQTRFWIQRVAVPLLMIIGLFGNLITMIIMTRRGMRSTTNMYLAALAFVDMLYLVLTFLLGLSHYPNMAGSKYYVYWKLRPFLMMLTDACSNTSVWLTVTFTIERYIAVKYPMKGKVWCTEKRAKMLIICVFVFGTLFATPVPFEWKVIEKRIQTSTGQKTGSIGGELTIQNVSSLLLPTSSLENEGRKGILSEVVGDENKFRKSEDITINDSYILTLDYSDFGKNETYKTIYYWSIAVIFYFVPLFSLMLFNGFLIKSVHQSQRERTKMTINRRTPASQIRSKSLTSNSKGDCHTLKLKGSSNQSLVNKETINNTSKLKPQLQANPGLLFKRFRWNRANGEPVGSSLEQSHSHLTFPLIVEDSGDTKSELISNRLSNQTLAVRTVPLLNDSLENKSLDTTMDLNTFADENDVDSICDNEVNFKQVEGNDISKHKSTISSTQLSIHEDPEDRIGSKGTIETIEGFSTARETPSYRSPIANNAISSSHQTIIPASTQERRITIMLIAVVILFLFCQIPSAAMLLYTSVREMVPNTNEHALVLAFGNIFNFLVAVNAAGNFILYSFLSKKYRRTFMVLFCSCLGSKQKGAHPSRMVGVRFELSGTSQRNSASIYQNSKTSDKVQKDTLV